MELHIEAIVKQKAWRELGLTDDEYDMICSQIGRKPNWVELGMFSVLWSEHCSYKHSRGLFHLFPTEGPQILEGPGENAGIVDIGDNLAVVFKVESHNSPSAIDPFQGAATGVGGILRDIFTMGARPVAVYSSLRFGELENDRVKQLFSGAIAGIADYSKTVHVPAVGSDIAFDASFAHNPLVNAMAVGVVSHDDIVTASASGVGNPVLVVGGKTGRDGIHGASFSSAALNDEQSASTSMQIADPETGARLIEACLEAIQSGGIVGIQDMGAAGLTSSSAEMAERAGSGIELDVSKVPCREDNMTPYEIMLSESQERMLVVPKKEAVDEIIAIFRKWDLVAEQIGHVTDDGMLRVLFDGDVVAEVPAVALSSEGAPLYEPEQRRPAYIDELNEQNAPKHDDPNIIETLCRLLSQPTLADKTWATEQFAFHTGDNIILGPGQASAALVRAGAGNKGIALSMACNTRYTYLNPYRGAQIAVAEAARNIVAIGGRPLAITDGMNFGSPENPEVFWQFSEAVRGISDACRALETPVTGGNVSFYNEKGGKAIQPAPMIGMVGVVEDVNKCVKPGWQNEGDTILLLGEFSDELGGSEYLALNGATLGPVPELDLTKERAVQHVVSTCIKEGRVASAAPVSTGGLATALANASIQGNKGINVTLSADVHITSVLFGETQSRFIVSAAPEHVAFIQKQAEEAGVSCLPLGTVESDRFTLHVKNTPGVAHEEVISIAVAELAAHWKRGIADAMQDVAHEGTAIEEEG